MMPPGVNLSFCVKRWVTPALWAPVVRERLGMELVQFSFDLVDPMWPDALLDDCAAELRRAAAAHGITVHSAFIGLAHYTFSQLLHPDARVRDVAEDWMARAYRFAASAGITRVGGPLGAIAARPDGAEDDAIPPADYADLLERLHRLGQRAAVEGITTLYVEPTPLRREWPWTTAQATRLLHDLSGSAVPWQLCVDWGHATFAPLYGAGGTMGSWLDACGDAIGVIHLQQTDGMLDRHWDFTQGGIVDPAAAAALQARHGLADVPTFLEVFYPFERDDASVLAAMAESAAVLRASFAAA